MLRVAVYSTGQDLSFNDCLAYKTRLRQLIQTCAASRAALATVAGGRQMQRPRVVDFPDTAGGLADVARAVAYGSTLPQEVSISTAVTECDDAACAVTCG